VARPLIRRKCITGLVDAVRDMRTIKRLLTQAEAEARSSGE
jgi:hypothetical protein